MNNIHENLFGSAGRTTLLLMKIRIFTLLLGLATVCTAAMAQPPKREMRAAWIATVANIDWPSKDAVGHTSLQQEELVAMLDKLEALHFNAVVFQVRPTADALYESDLEPWSNWLTGKQGQDNDVHYDPLAFLVEEAHKRCLDVHVWLNPYRVTNGFSISELADTHIFRRHPEWFVEYGKKWYFDPALPQTRNWLNTVVADIVTRYDVDAIHFDDYFYPYRVKGEEFPDNGSFRNHSRGFTGKDDWRRDNVNLVIEQLQHTIKSVKPWVEFGISPFGVWRNESSDSIRGSKTQAGVQNYDDLYADILLWLERGWIDYVTPQLYWEIGKKVADYEVLAHWWVENSYGKNLYVGHYVSQLGNRKAAEAWRKPNEICRQLNLNRTMPEIDGSVFFSMQGLLQNRQGICDSLQNNFYRYYALPPVNRNLRGDVALSPSNLRREDSLLVWDGVEAQGGKSVACYVVYAFPSQSSVDFGNPAYIKAVTSDCHAVIDSDMEAIYCVTAVNRYKQESLPCILVN